MCKHGEQQRVVADVFVCECVRMLANFTRVFEVCYVK